MPPPNRHYIEERRAKVAALLLENKSEREIARAVAISKTQARNDIAAVRAEWQERRLTDVGQWMAEELKRLDVAMAAIWPKVLVGDTWHIDRMLAIMERRAKYLGLDKQVDALPPVQMQVVVLNGNADETAELDADSLASLWRSRAVVPPVEGGSRLIGSGGDGEVERVS